MGIWKSVAEIQIDQVILAVHQAVVLHLVDRHLVIHQVAAHLPVDHRLVQVPLTRLVAHHDQIQVDLRPDHPGQIQIVVVKIYQRAVVHLLDLAHQVEIAKVAMQMIRAEFVPPHWIAINHDYVREFLNQIFPKMLLGKNLRKQHEQSF